MPDVTQECTPKSRQLHQILHQRIDTVHGHVAQSGEPHSLGAPQTELEDGQEELSARELARRTPEHLRALGQKRAAERAGETVTYGRVLNEELMETWLPPYLARQTKEHDARLHAQLIRQQRPQISTRDQEIEALKARLRKLGSTSLQDSAARADAAGRRRPRFLDRRGPWVAGTAGTELPPKQELRVAPQFSTAPSHAERRAREIGSPETDSFSGGEYVPLPTDVHMQPVSICGPPPQFEPKYAHTARKRLQRRVEGSDVLND